MKWEKLGQIFDPAQHVLAEGCTVFAKSPQAMVFDDFVRIYFSSQKKSDNGKYVSCPQYVDFNKGSTACGSVAGTADRTWQPGPIRRTRHFSFQCFAP